MAAIYCRACDVEFKADLSSCPSCLAAVPSFLMSDALSERFKALASTPITYIVDPISKFSLDVQRDIMRIRELSGEVNG